MIRRTFLLACLAVIGLGVAPACAHAQGAGNDGCGKQYGWYLTVTVRDVYTNDPVPGVVVAIRFNADLQLAVSDANGQVKFLVASGAYLRMDTSAKGWTSAGYEAYNMPDQATVDSLFGTFD